MKQIVFLFGMIMMACSSSKKSEENEKATGRQTMSSTPACIDKLIIKFKEEEKQNPPRSIYSYTYNDSTVYYVPPICCDQFSDLYNSSCNIIAHPDGGFTGKGDGRAKDFFEKRTNEKLIWKDERK